MTYSAPGSLVRAQVLSWGHNDYGQLGIGGTLHSITPRPVSKLAEEGVQVRDVNAGGWHSMCITTEGELYIWGRGEYGRLGLGESLDMSILLPRKMHTMAGVRVEMLSCGGTHTMALSDQGDIYTWGRGSFGRCGTGSEEVHYIPVKLELPGNPRVLSITCGGRHSICLAEYGGKSAMTWRKLKKLLTFHGHLHNHSETSGTDTPTGSETAKKIIRHKSLKL